MCIYVETWRGRRQRCLSDSSRGVWCFNVLERLEADASWRAEFKDATLVVVAVYPEIRGQGQSSDRDARSIRQGHRQPCKDVLLHSEAPRDLFLRRLGCMLGPILFGPCIYHYGALVMPLAQGASV